jgi:Sulfotransferase family
MDRLPDFVIIGAGKSATTWLHMALRKHKEVFLPEHETPFFEDPYYCESDLTGLFSELRNARVHQVAGIKRPNYLCTPGCADRLARHVPHALLIAMLRNPVERAVSQYFHLVRSGRIPVEDPNKAFGRYLSGQFESPYLDRAILKFGLYAAGLSEYVRLFPPKQILVFTDLDLGRDSSDLFRRVCRFVGVADDFVPKTISLRRNQGVYSLRLLSLIQSLNARGHAFVRTTGVAEQRATFFAKTARASAVFASRVSGFSRMLSYNAKPVISDEIGARLLEYYLPDIENLEVMMRMNLGAWKNVALGADRLEKVA